MSNYQIISGLTTRVSNLASWGTNQGVSPSPEARMTRRGQKRMCGSRVEEGRVSLLKLQNIVGILQYRLVEMRARPKGFFWRQLPDDHFQYRFFVASNTPEVHWATPLAPDLLLRKGQEIASAKIDGKEFFLKLPFSGKIKNLLQPGDGPNQALFLLQKCEHLPSHETSKIETCQLCGDELLSYEDLNVLSYTKHDFKQISNHDHGIQWNVAVNQQFSVNQVLGICGSDQFSLNFIGRVVQISNPKDRDEVILQVRKTVCLHEKVKDNICLTCHAYVNIQKTSITVQANGVINSGRLLEKLEAEFAQKLKQQKKLILILDLDNTIVHCIENYPGDEISFRQDDCLVVYAYPFRCLIKVRNFMREFLEKVLPRFDIYIYTKGTREYAEKICEHFRVVYGDLLTSPEYDEFFTPKRIISRNQDTSLTKKSLQNILTGYQEIILIMDDRKDVWQECRKNVVNTRYYQYYERENNKISIRPSKDHYLFYTAPFLEAIHSMYFQSEYHKEDVRNIIKIIQKQRLSNVKAFFLQESLKTNSFYVRAINMGIVDVGDWRKTRDYVAIYSPSFDHPDKPKVLKLDVPLVHELWIEYCYLHNFRFQWESFDVSKEDKISAQTPQERALFEEELFKAHPLQ